MPEKFRPGDKVVGPYAPTVGKVVAVDAGTTMVRVRWHPEADWTGLVETGNLRLATPADEVAAERAWHALMVKYENLIR